MACFEVRFEGCCGMRDSGLAIRVIGFRGVGFEVSSSGFSRSTGQGAGNARAQVSIFYKGLDVNFHGAS